LHDGEQKNIDFNRILVQVIGAGIGYDVKELFSFSDEEVDIDEQYMITLKSEYVDDFSRATGKICHNGRILRDGKTILGTELKTEIIGDEKIYHRVPATDKISLPLLHGGRMYESFSLAIDNGAYEDRYSSRVLRNGSVYRNKTISHSTTGKNFANDTMKLWCRKHHFHNGKYTRNGSKKHDGMILIPLE